MKMGYYLEHGYYQLYGHGQKVGEPLEKVAIAIDRDTGRWYCHGDLNMTISKLTGHVLSRSNAPKHGNNFRIICDRFTLDYLNRSLLIAEFVANFYDQVQARAHDTLDRSGNVIKGVGQVQQRAIASEAPRQPSTARATLITQLKTAYDRIYRTRSGLPGKLAMSAILLKALENGISYEEIDPLYHLALR